MNRKSAAYNRYLALNAASAMHWNRTNHLEARLAAIKNKHEGAIFAALNGGQSGEAAVQSAAFIFGDQIAELKSQLKEAVAAWSDHEKMVKEAWAQALEEREEPAAPDVNNEAVERAKNAGVLRRFHDWLLRG